MGDAQQVIAGHQLQVKIQKDARPKRLVEY